MHTILSSEWIHAALANYQVNINNHNLESCFQFLIGLSRSVCWSEDENRKYWNVDLWETMDVQEWKVV